MLFLGYLYFPTLYLKQFWGQNGVFKSYNSNIQLFKYILYQILNLKYTLT